MGYKCWNSKSIPRLIASQHFLPPSLMCNGASVFSWEQSCFSPQYLIHQHPIIQVIQVNTSNTRNASNESYACNTSNISNTSNSGQAGPKPMKAHLFHLSLSFFNRDMFAKPILTFQPTKRAVRNCCHQTTHFADKLALTLYVYTRVA